MKLKSYLFTAQWFSKENRINFFATYAKEHSFDPLLPENWYKQSRERITSTNVCLSLLLQTINEKLECAKGSALPW